MHIERLVKMANDIGAFFAAEPSRDDAVRGAAVHIERFWEPRMREQILAHLDSGGAGLDPLLREALAQVRRDTPGALRN